MKKCPKCGETKSLDNFTRSAKTKDGLRCWCKLCTKLGNAKWRANNLETWASYSAKWKQSDPEHALALGRAQYRQNPEKAIAKTRRWQFDNPGGFSVNTIRKRTKTPSTTPLWADISAIGAVYVLARETEKITGTRFHVDHIVPLRSLFVCGLHVHQNLQVLPGRENIAKGNKTWPDMWPITDELRQLVNQGAAE